MTRIASLVFILFSMVIAGYSQAATSHEAELVIRDGSNVRSTKVLLSTTDDKLSIVPKKGKKDGSIILPLSDIKQADYSYIRRSQVWEGLGNVAAYSLLCACVHVGQVALFVPYAFSKKKQHWFRIDTEKASVTLKLGAHDYRRLILELHKKGVNIVDSGNQKNNGLKIQKPV